MRQNGFNQRLKKNSVVEMDLYGVIGSAAMVAFEDDDYIQTTEVLKALRDMGQVNTLRLYWNSPGGSVYDGFQLANRLDKLREDGQVKNIESHAEGLVASAATLPFLKADKRTMRTGSRLMVHKPWAFGGGNAEQMRHEADRLDQTEQQVIDLYESVSALTRDEIAAAMDAETFYAPAEAEAAGFATDVLEPYAQAACMSAKLRAQFKHLPEDLAYFDPCDRERELRHEAETRWSQLQEQRQSLRK